mgnify:CR=1 FL=1
MKKKGTIVFSEIENTIQKLDTSAIAVERQVTLDLLADFIQSKVLSGQAVRLNFICTHNSRRSHLAQIWAQTMTAYFGIPAIFCYSGGTESTALFPMVAQTLGAAGFEIDKISEGNNPIYSIKYAANELPIIGFSKKIAHPFNPKSEFVAVMTCSQADEDCPLVLGAEKRLSLAFEDPKAFDGTPKQAQKYKERSLQIATELLYVFSKIKA